jgi:hypothetical protein
MKKISITILVLLLIAARTQAQTQTRFAIDTLKILLDENLNNFLTILKSERFQTFRDRKRFLTLLNRN